MTLVIEDKLKKSLTNKKVNKLVVFTKTCRSWAGVSTVISARFAGDDEVIGDNYTLVTVDGVDVYLPKEGITYGETVKLGYSGFFGTGEILVWGAKAL